MPSPTMLPLSPNGRKALPFLAQLGDLILIQLSNWRWSWRGTLITGMIAPVLNIVVLGIFARDSRPDALAYVLTGNVVLALMFENLNKVAGNFAFMRVMKTLDYFATLPIRGASLVLATVIAFLVLSLPAQIVTLLFGSVYLQVPLQVHPLIVVVIPLAAAALSGIGAMIGTLARTPEEAGSLSLLVTLFLLGIGPVILTPDRLPSFMLVVSQFSPATYVASALRQMLLGPVTARVWLDIGVLAVLAFVLLRWVETRLAWRRA